MGTDCNTLCVCVCVLIWWSFHHHVDFGDWSRACLRNVGLKTQLWCTWESMQHFEWCSCYFITGIACIICFYIDGGLSVIPEISFKIFLALSVCFVVWFFISLKLIFSSNQFPFLFLYLSFYVSRQLGHVILDFVSQSHEYCCVILF